MRRTRTVWIVSGGVEAVPGIERARALGLHVVVSDRDPAAPGFALAHDAVLASSYDVRATVDAARRFHRSVRPLDGVLCIAADVPHTVAAVAEALGLPGIPLASARLAMDKLAMKRRFAARGVPVPVFRPVPDAARLRALVRREPPLVIKPVDSRGARGVLRLLPDVDPDWAFAFARKHSPSGRVMVEHYLEGPQISTESLVVDGRVHTLGFSDRNYELLDAFAPHVIENGGDLPSALPPSQRAAVCRLVEQAAAALDITDGVVKGDIVVSGGAPRVIEIAPRLSGGYLCSHEIPLNTGVDFLGGALRLALGERPAPAELAPRFERPVCQRYFFPRPGRITGIAGVDEVRARPGVAHLALHVAPGDRVGPADSHPARAGMVITTGDTREEARQRAWRAVRDVRIETSPLAPAPRAAERRPGGARLEG